jgi:hypothetical protein
MTTQVHQIHDTANAHRTICFVEIANQYGNLVVRPIGTVAHAFAEIAGQKTLTSHTLRQIKKLGYRITIESGGEGWGYDFLNKFIGA